MLNLISDVLLKPYFDEKLRALKYAEYFKYANGLLGKEDVEKAQKGLGTLAELARNYPYRTQDIIDSICSFLRGKWSKERPHDRTWNEVLHNGLRILSSFPKKDANEQPYFVEVTQIRIRDMDLKGVNCEWWELWGAEFRNVNMTRSNFRNANLGGCRFLDGTSVEWSDFSHALMNRSFMDNACTTFDRARLWGSRFEDARIDACRMIIGDGFDAGPLKAKFGAKLEIVPGPSA